MSSILYVLLAILLFGVLIFIHELGHFIAALACKVKVNEFSIGMGPKLISKTSKKSGIAYSVRAFPIGGFVSMDGENEDSEDENALCNKTVWERILITVAGPIMNLLLGILLMAVLVSASSDMLASTTVSGFAEVSTSEISGLRVGDRIVEIDGTKVHTSNEVVYEIMMQGYEPIDMVVIRDGERKYLADVIFPVGVESGMLVGIYDFSIAPEEGSLGNIIKHTWYRSVSTVKMVWDSLYGLVSGRYGIEAMSGPIGITEQITTVAKSGDSLNLLYLFIVISMNLGVMNLLPIPALDGGHLIFYIIEVILGRPVLKSEVENYIHAIGMLLLLGFIGVICIKDVLNLFG